MVSVVFVQAAMYTSRMLCGFLPRNIFLHFYLKKKKIPHAKIKQNKLKILYSVKVDRM